jgi:hypothetical protein
LLLKVIKHPYISILSIYLYLYLYPPWILEQTYSTSRAYYLLLLLPTAAKILISSSGKIPRQRPNISRRKVSDLRIFFSLKRRTAKFPFSPLSPSFALVSPASPQRNRSSYLPPTFTAAAPENHRRTSPFKLPRLQTSRLPYPLDPHLLRRPPHRISFADSIDHRT